MSEPTPHIAYGLGCEDLCWCLVGRDHMSTLPPPVQVRGSHAPAPAAMTAARERRAVLVARERAEAAALERAACAQRVYRWAASLHLEHDRLVAAAAAEVVLEER